MKYSKLLFFLALTLAVMINHTACYVIPPTQPSLYTVLRVIDGDTIEVESLGKIRYIGIDTPELATKDAPAEYYAQEAKRANQKLLEVHQVRIETDLQATDSYGRTLAYVYVGDLFVNAYLIEKGYARVMTIPPNVKYKNLFEALEQEASEEKQGIWGRF